MPASKILTPSAYTALKNDVGSLIDAARIQAREAVARVLVTTYWKIGRRIDREKLATRAGYHNSILADLSADLDIDQRTLQHAVLFSRTYPKPPVDAGLSWAHFRELLRVRDPEQRQWYQQLALEEQLPAKRLAASITSDAFAQQAEDSPAARTRAPAVKLLRPPFDAYYFQATVQDVVDGDTLVLLVDLGFDTFRSQRVRLAAIDAPPLETAEGKQAHDFVRDRLARTGRVVIKTDQVDIYGRYVAHVFYLLREATQNEIIARGTYLNQELLDHHLAVPV
jgi:endonuclease YncB( thermonuclease family)